MKSSSNSIKIERCYRETITRRVSNICKFCFMSTVSVLGNFSRLYFDDTGGRMRYLPLDPEHSCHSFVKFPDWPLQQIQWPRFLCVAAAISYHRRAVQAVKVEEASQSCPKTVHLRNTEPCCPVSKRLKLYSLWILKSYVNDTYPKRCRYATTP